MVVVAAVVCGALDQIFWNARIARLEATAFGSLRGFQLEDFFISYEVFFLLLCVDNIFVVTLVSLIIFAEDLESSLSDGAKHKN